MSSVKRPPCSAEDRGSAPLPFAIERYFAGECDAWGIVVDRFGKLRRRFTVAMAGSWDGETFILNESFRYDNGEVEERVWRIRKDGPDGYVADADGIVGRAHGKRYEGAVNWRYRLKLTIGGREITVAFDDWLYQHGDDVVVNRASMHKFGIRLGEVILFFRPSPGQAPAASS